MIEWIGGDLDANEATAAVVLYDPADRPEFPDGSIVLAVGAVSAESARRFLETMSGRPAAVVFHSSLDAVSRRELAKLAQSTAIFALGQGGGSWLQLAAALRRTLDIESSADDPQAFGAQRFNDMFAVANAVSALVDAPVTIEDTRSRVLAFSARQDGTDQQRKETVLSQQVPEPYTSRMEERGLFQRVYQSEIPVFIDKEELGFDTSRTAISVRAGVEVLGSIWVAAEHPLTAERQQALVEASQVVALQILRYRANSRQAQRIKSELFRTVLEGGAEAASAAERLGVAAGPCIVLAVTDADATGVLADASMTSSRERLADTLAIHLDSLHRGGTSALHGGVVYCILPMGDSARGLSAVGVAGELLRRLSIFTLHIGIGREVEGASDLGQSKRDADRALRVLSSGSVPASVARIEEVYLDALLLELADQTRAGGYLSYLPLDELAAYDSRNGSEMLDTLEVWLEEQGNLLAVSQRLHLHVNTCRYRMARIAEISGLDLSSHEQRLVAMLHLRLLNSPHPDAPISGGGRTST